MSPYEPDPEPTNHEELQERLEAALERDDFEREQQYWRDWMKHVHHDKYLQALKEIEETGESEWEILTFGGQYSNLTFNDTNAPYFHHNCEFRKPLKKRYLKRSELPEPVREALSINTDYYVPSVASGDKYATYTWYGSLADLGILKRGIIYLTPEDAIAHTEALLATETE